MIVGLGHIRHIGRDQASTYNPDPHNSELSAGHPTVFGCHKSNKNSAHFRPCLHRGFACLLNAIEKNRGAAMLQNLTWCATDNLARSQFQVFSQIGEEMRLSEDDRRRVLLLSEREWADWSDFLQDGPLPAQPQLPVMLQRLGNASHRLAVIAEQQGMRS
jgi:hypothetical protein